MLIANLYTNKAGSYQAITIKKHLRALKIAKNLKLPIITLVDSAGAFIPNQEMFFSQEDGFGRIFYEMSKINALNIAQIAVVFGVCTAGGAYIPAMSDITIMVKNQGAMFLAGPSLVKAATGEHTNIEDLGGAYTHEIIRVC